MDVQEPLSLLRSTWGQPPDNDRGSSPPLYERLAEALVEMIRTGVFEAGDKLPAVRELSRTLEVSVGTVMAAYSALADRGVVSGHVGRGTFVLPVEASFAVVSTKVATVDEPAPEVRQTVGRRGQMPPGSPQPWRKRTLALSSQRLRGINAGAVDCERGFPDVRLLPFSQLKACWRSVIDGLEAEDVQYPSRADTEPVLAAAAVARLGRDGIVCRPSQVIAASSASQLVMLSIKVFVASTDPMSRCVAVEEPGHHSVMDALDRARCKMIGIAMDPEGARPDSLHAALKAGAGMVMLTPRAQNPTGASWTRERRAELAEVLRSFQGVLVVEDDHFGELAESRPGSLLDDDFVGRSVLYVRSFSKSIAPDLRLAVGVAGVDVLDAIREAKASDDGWTSRVTQRTVARLLTDPGVSAELAHNAEIYRLRRQAFTKALRESAHGAWAWPAADGLHVWVELPRTCDGAEILTSYAALGVLATPGEPFYQLPGNTAAIRVNAGTVDAATAATAGRLLGRAILDATVGHEIPITL